MNDRDLNYEELTEEDCEMIQVFSIVDRTGERRPAIFVFREAEPEDGQNVPEAVYWLSPSSWRESWLAASRRPPPLLRQPLTCSFL